jgi:hypothetical protein
MNDDSYITPIKGTQTFKIKENTTPHTPQKKKTDDKNVSSHTTIKMNLFERKFKT